MRDFPSKNVGVIVLVLTLLTGCLSATESDWSSSSLPVNVLIPHSRPWGFVVPGRWRAIEITGVDVHINILEATATTTMEIRLENNSNSRQEAEVVFPVPDDAVVRGFSYDGPGGEKIKAKILPRDEARRIYQQLVARIRDPALAEFIGYNLIRSSVFPVEPHGKQKVRLTYEHILQTEYNRIDYVLPRTESIEYKIPWKVEAHIKARQAISTVYSPSHNIHIERLSDKEIKVNIEEESRKNAGPFRLSILLEKNGVTASMFAYPDKKVGGGYFLVLAGLPVDLSKKEETLKREVTIVLDRSGSMGGEKIEQVKEAAKQIISALKEGEAFNVIIYNNNVENFSHTPVLKTRKTEEAALKYIDGITAVGGTNIYEALQEALSQKPAKGMLPIVLFLTDGLPTVGNTSEVAIRELTIKENPYNKRIFTFGVGFDVNAPLLEKIAGESRARAEFVLPKEDVEVKVGKVFASLSGPVLAEPELEVLGEDGEPAAGRVRDVLPAKLPDMFEGDRLILLGQYIGDEPLVFKISGNYLGKQRQFKFEFDFEKASTRNGFVSRLWAGRKIAEMIDIVRQMGAEAGTSRNEPKIKEIVDEIVRLSTEFGILTEYTAFLAKEETVLSDIPTSRMIAGRELEGRAMQMRSGKAAVSQSFNIQAQKQDGTVNYDNSYLNENMERVSISNVQQINDRAYYNKGNQWIDSRIADKSKDIRPDKTIEFGSKEFFELAERLAKEGRQGSIALRGDVILEVDGKTILIKMPSAN